MATVKWWLLSAIGIAFLVGKGSCADNLPDILSEDVRQSCVNVDCSNRPSCSSSAQCTVQEKCCIDVVNNRACCDTPALIGPNSSPSTSTSTTQGDLPYCGDLVHDPTCDGNFECICQTDADCFSNEICCIDTESILRKLECRQISPPPGATTPTTTTTTQNPQDPCPHSISDPQCIPGQVTIDSTEATCDSEQHCRVDEVCCRPYRGLPPCCVSLVSTYN